MVASPAHIVENGRYPPTQTGISVFQELRFFSRFQAGTPKLINNFINIFLVEHIGFPGVLIMVVVNPHIVFNVAIV